MPRIHPEIILRGDRNECPTCGQVFNSSPAFDKHRAGTFSPPGRHCLSPDQMTAKGMAKNKAGFWVTKPNPREWPAEPSQSA